MDFFSMFKVFPDEDFDRREENRAFARLVRVDWDSDSSLIAKNLAKLFQSHAPPLYNYLFTCIEESIRNVIDHAATSGYAVAQAQEIWGGNRVYQIAICDLGRGIRATLADDEDYRTLGSDRAALEVACKKGTGGKLHRVGPMGDPTNYGLGLWEIDTIAETTGGTFVLSSGNAVRIRDHRGVRFEGIKSWKGTSVEITLYLSGFRNVLSKPRQAGRIRLG